MTPEKVIKSIGFGVGILLFAFGVVIWRHDRYQKIDDFYASAFTTAGLIIMLIANPAILRTEGVSLALEASGYLLAAGYGARSFMRITRNKDKFADA